MPWCPRWSKYALGLTSLVVIGSMIECASCNCGSSTGGSVIPVTVPGVRCDYCGSGLVVYRRGGLFAYKHAAWGILLLGIGFV